MANKVYKCPHCKIRYNSDVALIKHVQTVHKELIADGMSVRQHLFNIRNKKTCSYCTICKKNKVTFNEVTGKYNRFCSEKCRITAGIIAEQNLKKSTGMGRKERLNNIDVQKSMLNNRSISGIYRFESGVSIPYVGSYEYDFLRFFEKDFKGSPLDIIQCPYTFTYRMYLDEEGIYVNQVTKLYEDHFYIPDFFIPSLQLLIEVKDGGDNPNNHPHMQLDRIKEYLKDEVIKKNNVFNYCKVQNKEYTKFINCVNLIKEQELALDKPERIYMI